MVDKFVMDIRERTASVSGGKSPAAIILFTYRATGLDLNPIFEKIDYAMSLETVIVGDGGGLFLYRDECGREFNKSAAVALSFARDRNKPHDIGETEFHVMLSTGVSPIGPTHHVISAWETRDECSTLLSARREGLHENLDGRIILSHIHDEIGDRIQHPTFLYIGVTKIRKCSIGFEKEGWVTSRVFHRVLGGDDLYLYVKDVGIETGDSFRFYHSDSGIASSSCSNASDSFRRLKQGFNHKNCRHVLIAAANCDNKEVFGGIIFSGSFCGEPFSPFLENFAGVPLAGIVCAEEIGCGDSSSYSQESEEHGSVHCCLHVSSTVFLGTTSTIDFDQGFT